MKKKLILSLLLSCIASFLHAQGFGQRSIINADWQFKLEDVKGGECPALNLQGWESIDLPHDWSVKGELDKNLASCTGYLPAGIAWYRKSLFVPTQSSDKKVYLYFEGVYNRSEVFVNGVSLGKRPNGYISFAYDATENIKFGEENTIALRVDHSQSADSRWYTGSGVYRDVWVVIANPIHIAQWGVFAYPSSVSKEGATLNVEFELQNETATKEVLSVKNTLLDAQGNVVESTCSEVELGANSKQLNKISIGIKEPKLWSIKSPYLYTLKTEVFKGDELLDETSTTTGFRNFDFDPNKGFSLNGENMKIKGVCLHHDAGVLGSAVPKEVWCRRLENLKSLGCNAIRTTHNPMATDVYELCDELGMLVMNEAYDEWEFPKRKWITGWNHGKPAYQGSFDIFKDWSEIDLADIVRRDRNHISVFAWSIGNEVDYPNDPYSHPILGGADTGFTQSSFGGYKKDSPDANRLGDIAKGLAKVVRQYDLSRPVTAGLAGVAMSNETEYPFALDIVGYNYTENRYKSDHEKYPNRVIFGSENRHDYKAWKQVVDNEHIFGQFLWTGIDYLGESGQWPSRGFYSGLLDLGGNTKPRGYFRKSLWTDEAIAYLGTYKIEQGDEDVWSQLESETAKKKLKLSIDAWAQWNYKKGEFVRVVCYTNGDTARLLLNGKEIGKQKAKEAVGIIYWDVAFVEGELKVEVFKENSLHSTKSIETTGVAYALNVEESVFNEETGLMQVLLNVVDNKGRRIMNANNEIKCEISGGAKLLGLESSNNSDMGIYTDNVHNAYKGALLAYILVDKTKAKDVCIKFSSPNLKGVDL